MKLKLYFMLFLFLVVGCKHAEPLVSDPIQMQKLRHNNQNRFGDVSVSLSKGTIPVEVLIEQAQRYISQRDKNFPIGDISPAIEFYPTNQGRCLLVLFATTLGEPFWQVSFDSTGQITDYQKGVMAEIPSHR